MGVTVAIMTVVVLVSITLLFGNEEACVAEPTAQEHSKKSPTHNGILESLLQMDLIGTHPEHAI